MKKKRANKKAESQIEQAKSAAPVSTDRPSDKAAHQRPQFSTADSNWVSLTMEDVLQTLSPQQQKRVDDWSRALTCPESEVATLTPEQRKWREQNIAERWPLYNAMESKLRKEGNEARHEQALKAIHAFDEQAAWFAAHTPHPFKVSYFSYIASLASVSCRYLQGLALHGNQHAIGQLARLTVEMTETLTELLAGDPQKVEANANLMRRLAARLPYWPMMQFRHAAANNHFRRVADLLELGKDCPINAAEQANYSLQTPINRFVWRCLKHFDEVHWIIRQSLLPEPKSRSWAEIVAAGESATHVLELVAAGKFNINPERQSNDPIEKALEPYVFTETDTHRFGMIHREEFPIYQESFKLAPLTKSNAQQWADSAIMPHIRKRFPDLREVAELHYLKGKVGKTGKRYAPVRKAVIQALQQLARYC